MNMMLNMIILKHLLNPSYLLEMLLEESTLAACWWVRKMLLGNERSDQLLKAKANAPVFNVHCTELLVFLYQKLILMHLFVSKTNIYVPKWLWWRQFWKCNGRSIQSLCQLCLQGAESLSIWNQGLSDNLQYISTFKSGRTGLVAQHNVRTSPF